jgi:hypothetical protein
MAGEIQSGVELYDYFIVPRILKCHDVVDLVVLTCCYDLIEERVILFPHVGPVDVLHGNHHSLLGLGHEAVKIRVKVAPELRILVPLQSLKIVDIPGLGNQLSVHGGVVGPQSRPQIVGGGVDLNGDLLLRFLRYGILS